MLVDVCLLVSHKCSLSILSFSVSISIGILIYNILITFLNCLHFIIYDIRLWGVNLDPRLNLIYFWKRFSGLYIFNCESSSSTIYNVCLFVCLSVCHKSWNSSVNSSPSQTEHSLRLTDQSEDSIRSAVSAEISFSI